MRRIEIYDTTLRDGSQSEGVSFSLEDKVLLARRLLEMGFDYVEGGFPSSNSKDSQFFARTAELAPGHERIAAFGMTRRRGCQSEADPGMRALINSGAKIVTVVGKSSEFHAREILRVTLDENVSMIAESVRFLRDQGRQVVYDAEQFFDGWKANRAYALRTILAAAIAGASRIVLCDTNGGCMPDEIFELTRAAIRELPVPVGIHCHNDCDLAVANSLAAVEAGAVQVQGTINGIGERCGNADLISVVSNLAFKKQGYVVLRPEGLARLAELSRYVYELVNLEPRSNQAFVGRSAFAHKAGMHAHAVARAPRSYEHMAPELVGNGRRFVVSELSGRSSILELTAKHQVRSDPAKVDRILACVIDLENRGYQFEAAGGSFDLLVKRCAGTFVAHFQLVSFKLRVEAGDAGTTTTTASIVLRVGTELVRALSAGDGPVGALATALWKALATRYPGLAGTRIVKHNVNVVTHEPGKAGRVRVRIETSDAHEVWHTIGVGENIVEASWVALVDCIEYKLHKQGAEGKEPARDAGLLSADEYGHSSPLKRSIDLEEMLSTGGKTADVGL